MRRFLVGCLFVLSAGSAAAERLPLRTYTVAEGLANNIINRIVRDPGGFLWFCTVEGLSLFDGYTFTNYGVGEGLPRPNVLDILATGGGRYLVATNAGLYRFDPTGRPGPAASAATSDAARGAMFTLVPSPEGGSLSITALLRARDGTVWCGTTNGLFVLASGGRGMALGRVSTTASTPVGTVNALAEDRHQSVWIGTRNGLYRRSAAGTWARYGKPDGMPDEVIHDLLEDRRGSLWIATRSGGLVRLGIAAGSTPPSVMRVYNSTNGLGADWIFDIHESPDGTLWVGTNLGLARLPATGETERPLADVYTRRQGFVYHEIISVTEDGDGNLWLGTIHGAMKMVRNGFVAYAQEEGIYTVDSLFASAAGELFASGYVLGDRTSSVFDARQLDFSSIGDTYWPRVGRFDGRRFAWTTPEAIRNAGVSWGLRRVLLSRTGEWWIGTGKGVYVFPPCRRIEDLRTARPLAVFVSGGGLATPLIYDLFEDSRGDVWISTAGEMLNGLTRWNRATRTLEDMATTPGLPSLAERLPNAIGEDGSGQVWVGFTPHGLARYSGGRFAAFTTDDGLPAGSMKALFPDRAGRLWIASSRGGVGRIDDPRQDRPGFVTLSIADGLSSNYVTALTEDLEGRIYAATGRGLDRIAPASGAIKHFTTADGLGPGGINAAWRDPRGVLWFGTTQGVLRFVPEAEARPVPPPIVINGLTVAGERQNVSPLGQADLALPALAYDRRSLQVDFVGLSFAPGQTLRYQYMLEGIDADWGPPTGQRSVTFARLTPGRYAFLVRAINAEGMPSETPARVAFVVLPPLWQRWWALALAGLAIALSAFGVYHYRATQLGELERVRRRIARDLHDDIGAGLSRISVLSEIASREATAGAPVTDRLSVVAGLSRELVDSMSDIVWVINPGRDQLRDLTQRMRRFASDVLASRGIDLVFRAPADDQSLKISADVRRQLFLIYKESINNIVRHAVCTSAEIELAIAGRQFVLTVKDDGRGFDVADASDGNGLSNMRDRARRIQGRLDIESGARLGTTITLAVPIDATVTEENTRLGRRRSA